MKRLLTMLLVSLTLLAGCAPKVPFEPTPLEATRKIEASRLIDSLWLSQPGTYRIYQTARFEMRWRKIPSEGVMKLDLSARTARLIALEGVGVKLFDLTITPESEEVNHLVPQLAEYPEFTKSVAESVRKIFFGPQPAVSDRYEIGERVYRLYRADGADRMEFVFGGSDPVLLERAYSGAKGEWRVRYYQYRPVSELFVPAGIVLEDKKSSFRLTLWFESVERIDE